MNTINSVVNKNVEHFNQLMLEGFSPEEALKRILRQALKEQESRTSKKCAEVVSQSSSIEDAQEKCLDVDTLRN